MSQKINNQMLCWKLEGEYKKEIKNCLNFWWTFCRIAEWGAQKTGDLKGINKQFAEKHHKSCKRLTITGLVQNNVICSVAQTRDRNELTQIWFFKNELIHAQTHNF